MSSEPTNFVHVYAFCNMHILCIAFVSSISVHYVNSLSYISNIEKKNLEFVLSKYGYEYYAYELLLHTKMYHFHNDKSDNIDLLSYNKMPIYDLCLY